jgi:hypothetical protein
VTQARSTSNRDSAARAMDLIVQRINDNLSDDATGRWANYSIPTVLSTLQEMKSSLQSAVADERVSLN